MNELMYDYEMIMNTRCY